MCMWHFIIGSSELFWSKIVQRPSGHLSIRPSICHKLFTFANSSSEATKLTTIIPLVVLKKCCILLKRLEIQDGCPGLWLAKIFLTSSLELVHVKSADLPELFFQRTSRSIVVFQCDARSNMTAPVFDWLKHFLLYFPKVLHLKSPDLP